MDIKKKIIKSVFNLDLSQREKILYYCNNLNYTIVENRDGSYIDLDKLEDKHLEALYKFISLLMDLES